MASPFETLLQEIRDMIYAECLLVENIKTMTGDDNIVVINGHTWHKNSRHTQELLKFNRNEGREPYAMFLNWGETTPGLFLANKNISADTLKYYYTNNEFVSIQASSWLLRLCVNRFIPLKITQDQRPDALPSVLNLELWHDLPQHRNLNDVCCAIMHANYLPFLVDFVNTLSSDNRPTTCDLGITPGLFTYPSIKEIRIAPCGSSKYYLDPRKISEGLLHDLKGMSRMHIQFTLEGFSQGEIQDFLACSKQCEWSLEYQLSVISRLTTEASHLAESQDYLGARGKLIVAAYMCGVNQDYGSYYYWNVLGNLRESNPIEKIFALMEIWVANSKVSAKLGRPQEAKRFLRLVREMCDQCTEIEAIFVAARLRDGDLAIAKAVLNHAMLKRAGTPGIKKLYKEYKALRNTRFAAVQKLRMDDESQTSG
ncbi:hypothetical protein GLAREA_10654 [Glarea lozoyensis ATCC 20868]|uniref:Uncharacterized protein n=1 Tax=Glarea lozoyensis (strain ATCC 20868 / MF5171) TaxID=1116229 RepID=S3DCZ0_GLAL2|nr:uncharacterized protein GLAREA_10654 [Glarea lozoyensis ATCC 20868]EPE34959.1 hypothetical protein GLAREA_10654 [Glarea lozoyensis ATCC 20868]